MSLVLPVPGTRRPLIHLLAALGLVLLALAMQGHDVALSTAARSWGGPLRERITEAVDLVQLFGKGDIAIAMALCLGAVGWRRQAAQILVALVITGILVTAIKWGIARERPNHGPGWSFPSGDAATAAALLVPLIMSRIRRWWWLGLGILAVAFGRVHQGYHYPSDVLVGCAVGTISAMLGGLLIEHLLEDGRRHLPRAGTFLLVAALFTEVTVAVEVLSRPAAHGSPLGTFVLLIGPALATAILARYARVASMVRVRSRSLSSGAMLAGLLITAVTILLWLSTRSSLWDRDEPRFATASLEMAASGDWVVPTFNGEWRLHKPAGIYWLMAPLLSLFGAVEWAARLPAVLAAGGILWLTWDIGRRLRDQTTGLLAAAMVVTSPLLIVSGTGATTDAVLVLFITAAMAVISRGITVVSPSGPDLQQRSVLHLSWPATAALSGAIAAAMLVKGPLGLLPVATLVLLGVAARRAVVIEPSVWWRCAIAVVGAFLLFGLWGIPALLRTQGAFLSVGVGKHIIQRGRSAMESHGGGIWYYLPVVVAAFFPWTALLPMTIHAMRRHRSTMGLLMLWWAIPTFVIFSLYATKLPTYILPIFPALALATAGAVTGRGEGVIAAGERIGLMTSRWLLLLMTGALAGVLVLVPWIGLIPTTGLRPGLSRSLEPLQHMDHLLAPLAGAALVLIVLAVLGARAIRTGRLREASLILVIAMAAFTISLGLTALPAIERYKPSKALAQSIRAATPPSMKVWVLDYDEPSLHFYLGRGPLLPIDHGDVTAWAKEETPAILVLSRQRLDAAIHDGARDLHLIAGPVAGINLASGHWVELVAVARGVR